MPTKITPANKLATATKKQKAASIDVVRASIDSAADIQEKIDGHTAKVKVLRAELATASKPVRDHIKDEPASKGVTLESDTVICKASMMKKVTSIDIETLIDDLINSEQFDLLKQIAKIGIEDARKYIPNGEKYLASTRTGARSLTFTKKPKSDVDAA